ADVQRGPDGKLYIASVLQNRIARFDTTTQTIESFAQSPAIATPDSVTFHDGDVFVGSFAGDKVVRLDGTSGVVEGDFVTPGAGGLDGPQYLLFIPEPLALAWLPLPLLCLPRGT